MLLGIEAVPANVQDRDCAAELIRKTRRLFPFVCHVFADGGYRGDKRRRWVVERTFSWLRRNRRLMARYEAIAIMARASPSLP